MLTSNSNTDREARIRYLDGGYNVLAAGDYVVCAATGKKIPLEMLCYWSVDLQEAYYDAAASTERKAQLVKP